MYPSFEPVVIPSLIHTDRDHIPAFTLPVPWIRHNNVGFVKKSSEIYTSDCGVFDK